MTAAYPDVDERAPCRSGDPDRFFPHNNTTAQSAAKITAECKPCPFLSPCLLYALDHNVQGVWGATTDDERTAIRRTRGIVAEPLMIPGITQAAYRPKTPENTASCGTVAGYFVHVRRKQETCKQCRAAFAAYSRERKAKGKAS